MKIPHLKTIMLLIVMIGFIGCSHKPPAVQFIVEVPSGTDQVTIVGNHPSLGEWDAAQIRLERIDSLHFSYLATLEVGDTIEYKFTQGSWISEALDDSGHIPPNYSLTVKNDTLIRHTIPAWRDTGYSPGCGITGTVRYHSIYSPQLANERNIIVWLPPSYRENESISYPVLYMHDGQNIIDSNTGYHGMEWQVDEIATTLIDSGLIREIIVVGIYNNADRTAEYSPVHRGELYSDFLVNTVKPLIDSTYRTLTGPENTAIMGSSMGGIISFHLAWEYPKVFGMAGCLSPAFIVDEGEIVKRVANYTGPAKPIKLYIDNGTVGLEARLQPAIDNMMPLLAIHGFNESGNLIYMIAEGAEHNEPAWAKRIHVPLKFFFGINN